MGLQARPATRTTQRTASAQLVTFATTLALDGAGLDALVEAELASDPALERDETRPSLGASPLPPDALTGVRDPRAELVRDLAASLPAADRAIAQLLVAELDHRGFLSPEVLGTAARAGWQLDRVERAIDVLRQLGPAGLAEAGPVECILAQLATVGVPPGDRRLAERILRDHLSSAAAGDLERIADELQRDVGEVRHVLDLVRAHTRPSPCWDDGGERVPPSPDLVVRDDGDLVVECLERRRHPLRVATSYARLAPDHADVARAEGFLTRLEERWRTLERIGGRIVRHQEAHVRDRREPLLDLSRAAVAADLGLHPSTVSRAVAHRAVTLPDGRTVPLGDLFAAGEQLRRELAHLLAVDGPHGSDAALARELRSRGYQVARRTVAKYRFELRAGTCPGR